jgi:hypothetical protein
MLDRPGVIRPSGTFSWKSCTPSTLTTLDILPLQIAGDHFVERRSNAAAVRAYLPSLEIRPQAFMQAQACLVKSR